MILQRLTPKRNANYSYSTDFKLKAVAHVKRDNTKKSTARKFDVDSKA